MNNSSNLKRAFAMALALTALASTFTGCGKSENNDIMGMEDFATVNEVRDYYASELSYDSIITRKITENVTNYVKEEVDEEYRQLLQDYTHKIEEVLSKDEYDKDDKEIQKLISENEFNYIKGQIDSLSLSDGAIENMQQAKGFYFVDVKYNVTAQESGKFKECADMTGLNGLWITDTTGKTVMSEAYIQLALGKLNDYFYEKKMPYKAEFDKASMTFKIVESLDNLVEKQYGNEETTPEKEPETEANTEQGTESDTEQSTDNTENEDTGAEDTSDVSEENTDNSEEEPTDSESADNNVEPIQQQAPPEQTPEGETAEEAHTEQTPTETDNIDLDEDVASGQDVNDTSKLSGTPSLLEKEISENSVLDPSRRVTLDINFINSVVGSVGDSACLPQLDLVYEIPSAKGISGYGIYQEGANGFFGFDRSKLAGTVTIRYVFKDSIDGSGNIVGTNAFILNQEITTGFSTTEDRVNVAEFLRTELESAVERNDRLQANGDISGLMSGGLYEDKGAAILRAFKANNTNTLRYASTIRNILARDTEHNAYLLEVETTAIDGAINCNSYGTYRDTYYVVVQQQGQEFVIADSIKMKRETVKEPDISPDSTTAKRLVALNLSDVVTDDAKAGISDMLTTLYTAGTNRIASASEEEPAEVGADGNKVTLTRGLEECFNSDREMLSEDNFVYLLQELESALVKQGVSVDAIYKGKVTEWIGGYKDEQVEFMAQELITYSGTGSGYYMEVYYLVSNRDGQWVIDERNIINESDATGADLEQLEKQVS